MSKDETTQTHPSIRAAALCFLAEFDEFMDGQDLFPDELAEARRKLVEALDE